MEQPVAGPTMNENDNKPATANNPKDAVRICVMVFTSGNRTILCSRSMTDANGHWHNRPRIAGGTRFYIGRRNESSLALGKMSAKVAQWEIRPTERS